jgi:integrase
MTDGRGRKRSRANSFIPKHVEVNGKNWVHRKYIGVVDGKKKYTPRTILCSIKAPTSELFLAYDNMVENKGRSTVKWLLTQYQTSPHVKSKPSRTRGDYDDYLRIICGYQTLDGLTLGEQPLSIIRKTTIRAYLDKYKGGKAPIAANRHVQYLRAAWNWAVQRHDGLPENPCEKVTLNKAGVRDRYVTDEEFTQYKEMCHDKSVMPLAMEIAYLCRLRANEVYSIQKSHVGKIGLRVFRGKGSKGEITRWTVRLRSAVDACLARDRDSELLLTNEKGGQVTMSNHKSQWQRLQVIADKNQYERFTFHDLKAKGYTDQDVQDAGHMSPKMHKVYDRKGRVVEPANGELSFED